MVAATTDGPSSRTSPIWSAAPVSAWTVLRVSRSPSVISSPARRLVQYSSRGVALTQVADWAGHSVEILLRVYAKCLEGQDEIAKRRIAAALADVE